MSLQVYDSNGTQLGWMESQNYDRDPIFYYPIGDGHYVELAALPSAVYSYWAVLAFDSADCRGTAYVIGNVDQRSAEWRDNPELFAERPGGFLPDGRLAVVDNIGAKEPFVWISAWYPFDQTCQNNEPREFEGWLPQRTIPFDHPAPYRLQFK